MSLSDYKLPIPRNTAQDVTGLVKNPSSNAQINKDRFDLLVKNVMRSWFNDLIDGITSAFTEKSNKIVGEIKPFAGSTAPSGTLLCDGSAVSRTTYSGLFSAIGTTWGTGDGSTTFNLPDLGGKTLIGKNSTYALGATGGEATHTLTTTEMPSHTHNIKDGHNDHKVGSVYSASGGVDVLKPAQSSSVTDEGIYNTNTGGGAAHNNMQPYAAISYVIVY